MRVIWLKRFLHMYSLHTHCHTFCDNRHVIELYVCFKLNLCVTPPTPLPPLTHTPQVKTGMLRSEHQKNASRTIRETVDTQINKRNKERDKDKDKSHQMTVSLTQDSISEGESSGASIITVSGLYPVVHSLDFIQDFLVGGGKKFVGHCQQHHA